MNSAADPQGTVASNIAYGAPKTPKEALEREARQANCDFIWGMPERFKTKSRAVRSHGAVRDINANTSSWEEQSERRTTVLALSRSMIML